MLPSDNLLIFNCDIPPCQLHTLISYTSGLISLRNHNDIAIRLRNKLSGKAMIVTIEISKKSLPSLTFVIRRSRAVPFRIENFSSFPIQFAQQQHGIIRKAFYQWSDSTIILPYHQAD